MDHLLFNKAAAYCAYQERTQEEVRVRLRKWKAGEEEAEEIIAALIVANFLSETRFARAYGGGKFRIKHWGRLKIQQELARKGVSPYNAGQAMAEIDPEEYRRVLTDLLQKKHTSLLRTVSDTYLMRQKLTRYALSKGYEADLVREVLEMPEVWTE